MNLNKVYIVAEIGCNHNGSKELARKMIDVASKCGVDAIKFQTFSADRLISKFAPKAEYQKKTTGNLDTQLEMTRKLELSKTDYIELAEYALNKGVDVFSTPFDSESIKFLASRNQKVWKIPSGEITNLPYLEEIANLDIYEKKIILSTGMATISEIENAINILLRGNCQEDNIIILHCNTEYPTPYKDVNLLAINKLKTYFPKLKIGFSDHSEGYFAGIAAVPLGIKFIEKHFTLDKNLPGPDHKASITPSELRKLCQGIRVVEESLGKEEKIVTDSEKKNKIVARKSIIADKVIKKGELFTTENLTTKRPGNGISPLYWYDILGKEAQHDFEEDELIRDSRFKNQ